MFYILHGDDEFSQSEELKGLRGRLSEGDPAMADLNTTLLSGTRLTIGELRHVCDTIPFLAERRLVIVEGYLTRLSPGARGKGAQENQTEETPDRKGLVKELAAYLPALPPSTRLIFVEDKMLPASHPILKLAESEAKKERAYIRQYQLPKEWELPDWIARRTKIKGGNINSEAISLLAVLLGTDLRLIDQEIDKLLLYAGERAINAEDVRTLVSRARETSIFDLVDCVGQRQPDRALRLLHRMLDDEAVPLYLLTMLARQFRILIQVREMGSQGVSQNEMASQLKLHPYAVKKGVAQAQNFTMSQLEACHLRLIETDWKIKTGQIDEILALDTLLVDLTSI